MYQNLKDEVGDIHAMQPPCQVGLRGGVAMYICFCCVFQYMYVVGVTSTSNVDGDGCLLLNLWRQQLIHQDTFSIIWTLSIAVAAHVYPNAVGEPFSPRRGVSALSKTCNVSRAVMAMKMYELELCMNPIQCVYPYILVYILYMYVYICIYIYTYT